jgi:O-antigen ligase
VSLTVLFGVVLAPLVVAYVVACFRDPLRYALPPYAVLIPFSSLISLGPGAFGSLSSLLGLLLGLALIVQLVTTRRGSAIIPLVVPVWLAFLALSAFSLFWSIAPTATVSDFEVLASQIVLFVALVLTRFDAAALRRFGTALVVGGVLVPMYFLAQASGVIGLPGGRFGSGTGRYGDDLLGANNQAASLLLPLAIAATRALSGSRNSRVLNGVGVALMVLGVIMTGSRGGLLSTVIVLAIVLFLSPARRAFRIGLAATATVLLAVVLVVQPGGIGTRQVDRQANSSGRTDIWSVGLHACQVYCVAGAGWGGFPSVYEEELASVPDANIMERGTAFEPHNIFLLAVIQVGVVGLLLTILGLGLALAGALRLPSVLRAPPVAALVGTLVSSFFLSNMQFKFFWAVLAFVAISETVVAGVRQEKGLRPLPQLTPLTAAGREDR